VVPTHSRAKLASKYDDRKALYGCRGKGGRKLLDNLRSPVVIGVISAFQLALFESDPIAFISILCVMRDRYSSSIPW